MKGHDFRLGEPIDEPRIPSEWHRVHATCSRCGEHRRVFHAVPMDMLNRGVCATPNQRRREERRIARRYMHRTRFRPCGVGRFCALCWWRKVSGQHRRELAAHLARAEELRGTMTPVRMVRGEDGRWRRSE